MPTDKPPFLKVLARSPREQLPRTIGARNLLEDLRDRLISTAEFRRSLERIVRDPRALDELMDEREI